MLVCLHLHGDIRPCLDVVLKKKRKRRKAVICAELLSSNKAVHSEQHCCEFSPSDNVFVLSKGGETAELNLEEREQTLSVVAVHSVVDYIQEMDLQ